jgi:hypothetical protein
MQRKLKHMRSIRSHQTRAYERGLLKDIDNLIQSNLLILKNGFYYFKNH